MAQAKRKSLATCTNPQRESAEALSLAGFPIIPPRLQTSQYSVFSRLKLTAKPAEGNRYWWTKNRDFEFEMDVGGHPWMRNAGGEIRRGSSTVVHRRPPVLKSAMNCPPGAVFVRCDLPVLLHALLHVAMNVVFRAVSFRRIILAVHSPPFHFWSAATEVRMSRHTHLCGNQ